MATQYHFLVCCKKIAETEWTLEMQADSGEVPMSIVHPDSETDRVLTANPITQTIAEARIMTQYLRQLNRYSGSGAIGHNDSVIRSISQRLSQLQLGQQITVKISCFKYKGLRSGTVRNQFAWRFSAGQAYPVSDGAALTGAEGTGSPSIR